MLAVGNYVDMIIISIKDVLFWISIQPLSFDNFECDLDSYIMKAKKKYPDITHEENNEEDVAAAPVESSP